MKRPALQTKRVRVLRMAFRARKAFGTFEKRAPGLQSERCQSKYTVLKINGCMLECSSKPRKMW